MGRHLCARAALLVVLCVSLAACTWSTSAWPATADVQGDRPVGAVAGYAAAPPVTAARASLQWQGAFGLVAVAPSAKRRHPDMRVVMPDLLVASSYDVMPQPHMASRPVVSSRRAARRLRQWCHAMAQRLRPVRYRDCLAKDFSVNGYRSVEGRPLALREVAPAHSRGRILLIGGVHGDEVSSVSLVFEWLRLLLAGKPEYTWHVVPSVNPDGLLAGNPQRVNAHGVDLNRNLPTIAWQQESRRYWRSVNYEARRYPGKAPASEPETQWLVDEIAAFRPDVIISVHAPYGVLDYNGALPAPRRLGDLHLHRLGVYPGSLGNYASRMLGIPVITIELGHAWELPSPREVRHMWADLKRWLTRYVGHVRQARATPAPHVSG